MSFHPTSSQRQTRNVQWHYAQQTDESNYRIPSPHRCSEKTKPWEAKPTPSVCDWQIIATAWITRQVGITQFKKKVCRIGARTVLGTWRTFIQSYEQREKKHCGSSSWIHQIWFLLIDATWNKNKTTLFQTALDQLVCSAVMRDDSHHIYYNLTGQLKGSECDKATLCSGFFLSDSPYVCFCGFDTLSLAGDWNKRNRENYRNQLKAAAVFFWSIFSLFCHLRTLNALLWHISVRYFERGE